MMSALSGFAEYEERVKKTFVNTTNSDNGIYGVNFYSLGVPHTVVIDDYLPLLDGGENTIYGKLSQDNGLWGPLIEKALAKLHGNYEHLDGGWPEDAVSLLTGGPSTYFVHKGDYEETVWSDGTILYTA